MNRLPARGMLLVLALAACPLFGAPHGDLLEKIAHLNRWIRQDPGNAVLYLRRGELHRMHCAWDHAEADYARALALNPGLSAITLCRARLAFDAGRLKRAESEARLFLESEPRSAQGWLTLGRILERRARPLDAARAFDKAIKHTPRARPVYFLDRARLLLAAGGEHREEALSGLQAGLERLHGAAALELEAIRIERDLGRPEKALKRVVRLAAHAPRKEPWLVLKAEVLLQAGRPGAAAQALSGALSRLARLPHHVRTRGATRALERRARLALVRSREQVKLGTR